MPIRSPTSPALVVQNALSAARAASGLRYQNPINKYEQTPTSSQHMKSCNRLGASTTPIIEKANSDWKA